MASWQALPPPPPEPQLPVWQQALNDVSQFWHEVWRWLVAGGVLGMGVVMPIGVGVLGLGWLVTGALRKGRGVETTTRP